MWRLVFVFLTFSFTFWLFDFGFFWFCFEKIEVSVGHAQCFRRIKTGRPTSVNFRQLCHHRFILNEIFAARIHSGSIAEKSRCQENSQLRIIYSKFDRSSGFKLWLLFGLIAPVQWVEDAFHWLFSVVCYCCFFSGLSRLCSAGVFGLARLASARPGSWFRQTLSRHDSKVVGAQAGYEVGRGRWLQFWLFDAQASRL